MPTSVIFKLPAFLILHLTNFPSYTKDPKWLAVNCPEVNWILSKSGLGWIPTKKILRAFSPKQQQRFCFCFCYSKLFVRCVGFISVCIRMWSMAISGLAKNQTNQDSYRTLLLNTGFQVAWLLELDCLHIPKSDFSKFYNAVIQM